MSLNELDKLVSPAQTTTTTPITKKENIYVKYVLNKEWFK